MPWEKKYGNLIFLAIIAAGLVINIGSIGIIKAVLILVGTIVLLFVNLFNPYNPFKLLQHGAVTRPGKKEYELAMELIINILN